MLKRSSESYLRPSVSFKQPLKVGATACCQDPLTSLNHTAAGQNEVEEILARDGSIPASPTIQTNWLQFFAVMNFQITATMAHATKQQMMRKMASVQRVALADSSAGNEARSPFTKCRNIFRSLPILLSPLDFESFADPLPIFVPLLLDDYRSSANPSCCARRP
jgi:hypothetical protein